MNSYSNSYIFILSAAIILLVSSQVLIVNNLLSRERSVINNKVEDIFKNIRVYPDFWKSFDDYERLSDEQKKQTSFRPDKVIKELALPLAGKYNSLLKFKDSIAKIGIHSKVYYGHYIQSYQLRTKKGWQTIIPYVENPIKKDRLLFGDWSNSYKPISQNDFYVVSGKDFRLTFATVYKIDSITGLVWKNILPLFILILVSSGVLIWAGYITFRITVKEKEISLLKMNLLQQLAHSFRTPLSVTRMAVRMLKNNPDQTLLNTIDEQQKKLDELTSNILYRADHIKQQINCDEKISLFNEVDLIMEDMKIKYPDKEIKFSCSFEADPVTSNRILLLLALENLIDNAIKYSENTADIYCYSIIENNQLEIGVIDHGIGIKKGDISKIGESYFRTEEAMAHTTGFGLGLYILKQELKQIYAYLSWQNNPEKGATFKIIIPQL